MHIITGGTGHVGSALAKALARKGEKVTIVSRNTDKKDEWKKEGVEITIADVFDTKALHEIFKKGDTVFLLNPPADPSSNTDVEERKSVASMIAALKDTNVKKIVVESTLGAQPGNNIGDLGVLYELEQQVSKQSIPYCIIRPAYYMSNWETAVETIKKNGELVSFFPADLKIPMVAPQDIGALAAELLTKENCDKITSIYAPELYSANDVADAFSTALNTKVKVKVIPKEQWVETYKSMHFSNEAAKSYAGMMAVSVEGGFDTPEKFVHAKTTLQEYIKQLADK